MRRTLGQTRAGALAMVLAALPGVAAASEPDQVILSVQCQLTQGRIVLVPAANRAHRIIGPYRSHAHTLCAPGQPDRCRTWTIHRFDLACGGHRVPWLDLVAAANDRNPGRTATLDGGRLVIRLGPEWRGRADTAPRHAFPAGYAPAIGLTARFVGAGGAPPTVASAATRAEAPARPVLIRTPNEPLTSVPLDDLPGAPADGWITTIAASALTSGSPGGSLSPWRVAGTAVALGAAWAALLWFRRRHTSSIDRPTIQAAPPAGPDDEAAAHCSALIARAVNLHRAARDALPAVMSESLRPILERDLASVQSTLLAAKLTQEIADGNWPIVRVKVSAAVTDLERIGGIIAGLIDSARLEPARVPQKPTQPETLSDAFEVLGINPHASRSIIKKVVDGLRQSWHPDHARDEADRSLREARMKQINAAWDLIRADLPETTRPAA